MLSDISLTDIKHSHFQEAINRCIDKPRTCQQIYITFKQIINSVMMTKSSYVKMWASIIKKMNDTIDTNSFDRITDLTAHIFRHNYCTNLCYHVPEISIKKIASLLGDTEKMVLNVYNHIIEEKEDVSSVVNHALAL